MIFGIYIFFFNFFQYFEMERLIFKSKCKLTMIIFMKINHFNRRADSLFHLSLKFLEIYHQPTKNKNYLGFFHG